jgi:uncharacterized protein (DUF1778 family)
MKSNTKRRKLELRLTEEELALIDAASSYRGRSKFVREAAMKRARRELRDREVEQRARGGLRVHRP